MVTGPEPGGEVRLVAAEARDHVRIRGRLDRAARVKRNGEVEWAPPQLYGRRLPEEAGAELAQRRFDAEQRAPVACDRVAVVRRVQRVVRELNRVRHLGGDL